MIPTRSIAVAILLAVFSAGCGWRERATPTADRPLVVRLSTNETVIGRPVLLSAAVAAPADADVVWPTPGAPPTLVMRNSREERHEYIRSREWELIPLRPGICVVWTGSVQVLHAHGSRDEWPVERLELTVRRTLSETNWALRDVTGLERWPEENWKRMLLALGAVVGLALLAALIAVLARRARKPAPPEPEIPPHERALRALRMLRAKYRWGEATEADAAQIESYYVELSAIVRRYLEDAFGLRAPEQTTEEFIRAATTSQKLTLDHQQRVAAFLEQSDLVKFARYRPAAPDMEAAYSAAEQLVLETMPRPTAAAPASPAPRPV